MSNNPAAPSPSDSSIAQAFRDYQAKWPGDADTGMAGWIGRRAREIDASAPAAAVGDGAALPEASPETKGVCNDERACANCYSGQGECLLAGTIVGISRDLLRQVATVLGRYDGDDDDFRTVRNRVNKAMQATPAAPVGGFVVVPRTITPEMEDAANQRDDDEPASDWGKSVPASRQAIWDAMIAASPAAQPSAKDGVRGDDIDARLKDLTIEQLRTRLGHCETALAQRDAQLVEATTGAGLVDGVTHVAILADHNTLKESAVIVPPGQSLDFDEHAATREWLWPYLNYERHLSRFVPIQEAIGREVGK